MVNSATMDYEKYTYRIFRVEREVAAAPPVDDQLPLARSESPLSPVVISPPVPADAKKKKAKNIPSDQGFSLGSSWKKRYMYLIAPNTNFKQNGWEKNRPMYMLIFDVGLSSENRNFGMIRTWEHTCTPVSLALQTVESHRGGTYIHGNLAPHL